MCIGYCSTARQSLTVNNPWTAAFVGLKADCIDGVDTKIYRSNARWHHPGPLISIWHHDVIVTSHVHLTIRQRKSYSSLIYCRHLESRLMRWLHNLNLYSFIKYHHHLDWRHFLLPSWNSLPEHILSSPSVEAFKTAVTNHIWSIPRNKLKLILILNLHSPLAGL